ncbi:MAG TPA: hypothetical protein VFP12_04190 [Allosphingosinicella sp.]|nr:hypothetical protein [Allosphingosinicella sp.]
MKRAMGAKFCFFTDPAKLAAQQAAEAFGPATAVSSKDRFRVTDVHQTKQGQTAVAYAACTGRICVQAVPLDGGSIETVNLILRPLKQPLFDFPYIEYFIYRGIRRDSLLKEAGKLAKPGSIPERDLVGRIEAMLNKKAAQPSSNPPPLEAYFGLDRVHSTDPAAVAGGLWGDDQPLDHLFRYRGNAEVPRVEVGSRLGEFIATSGFEVVIQSYGAQPTIGWARRAVAWIEADPVVPTASAAANYASRLQHEAIGCFVDPCPFWGMFHRGGLMIGPPKKKPNDDKILEQDALRTALFGASIFANKERVYLDVRNEVGLSYDFYGTYQDRLKIVPDDDNLPDGRVYGRAGWPLHFLDSAPQSISFRLRRDGSPVPLLFLRQDGRSAPGPKRFEKMAEAGGADWTKVVTLKRPGKSTAPPWWFVGHYLRGQVGTSAPAVAGGVFDTSGLQFGPIGDRVVGAYRQLWPDGSATAVPLDEFVTDKVIRYDGTLKDDPAHPEGSPRALSYDRMGETAYILRRDAGKDSVIMVQTRAHKRQRDPIGTWIATNPIETPSWTTDLLRSSLLKRLLSTPVSIAVPGGNVVVHSSRELLENSPFKSDLFDLTILLLTRADFDQAVQIAAPAGTPVPAPGRQHPVFLALGPTEDAITPGASYGLQWMTWDGSATVRAATAIPVYSADGIFYCSAGFDLAGLGSLAETAPAECPFAIDSPQGNFNETYKNDVPWRIVHHTAESDDTEGTIKGYNGGNFPHFTVDGGKVHQHISINRPSRALRNLKELELEERKKFHLSKEELELNKTPAEFEKLLIDKGFPNVETNQQRAIQIELIGFAGDSKDKATLTNTARLCRWIETEVKKKVGEKTEWEVKRIWPAGPPQPPTPEGHAPKFHHANYAIWENQGGHYGHSQVPENASHHWDPGYTQVEADFILNAEFTADGMLANPDHPLVQPLLNRVD